MSKQVRVADDFGIIVQGVVIYNADKTINTVTDYNGNASLGILIRKTKYTLQSLKFETRVLNDFKNRSLTNIQLTTVNEVLEEVVLSVAQSELSYKQIAKKVAVINSVTPP